MRPPPTYRSPSPPGSTTSRAWSARARSAAAATASARTAWAWTAGVRVRVGSWQRRDDTGATAIEWAIFAILALTIAGLVAAAITAAVNNRLPGIT